MAERPSKKRKTRSGCTGMELFTALQVLQKFRSTVKTEDLVQVDNGNLERTGNPEVEIEIEIDVLAQLDGLIKWMNSKIKTTKEVSFWLHVIYKRFHSRSRAMLSPLPAHHS